MEQNAGDVTLAYHIISKKFTICSDLLEDNNEN